MLGMQWFGKTSHFYRNFLSAVENLFTGVLGQTGFKVNLETERERYQASPLSFEWAVLVLQKRVGEVEE